MVLWLVKCRANIYTALNIYQFEVFSIFILFLLRIDKRVNDRIGLKIFGYLKCV